MPKAILAEQGKSGSSIGLLSIEITTAPTKTSYLAGDTFDSTGMVVTATYGTDSIPLTTTEVGGYTVSPSALTDGTTSVTISYTENGVTCTATQAVTVTHKLASITITTSPTTTSYEYGDALSTSGMVVTANYSDSSTATVTGYTCSPTSLTTVGTQTITVSYTENSVTQTTTFSVTVTKKSVSKPTWKSNLTYSGSSQSVNSTSYWNNYNTTYMSMSGTTSATNAGTYSATFTPNSNYQWSDGTTSAISVSWTINKATYTFSVSPTSVSITADNYSSGVVVTVTRSNTSATGTVTATSSNTSICTTTVSGNAITIKGNGSTAGTATVTVSISETSSSNFNSPTSTASISVESTYDLSWSEWGDETATGNATWWTNLKTWAASATAKERAACVGKTKSVTLTTAVQGTTTHLVRCIGADQDGTGTLTFQTKNCMSTTAVFGSSSAKWIGSTARSLCQNYYSYFPGKSSIKTVSKGTCASYSDSRAASVTYNNETVWLPSEREMGLNTYSPISTANSTTTSAECTYGYNASYSYYNSNSTRIKYQGDSGTSAVIYWERSRYYSSGYTSGVCVVYAGGSAYWNYYGASYGLAPAFVIG